MSYLIPKSEGFGDFYTKFVQVTCRSRLYTAMDASKQGMTLYKRQDATDKRLLGWKGGGGAYTRQVASAFDHVTLKNSGQLLYKPIAFSRRL